MRAFRAWGLGSPALALLSVLSLLSIARSIIFIVVHYTPQAFFDYWLWVSDFQRWVNGQYTLHDLIKPHYGQHRIATTRLLLLMDSALFKMSGTSIVTINALLLATLGLLLWWLARGDGVARSGWSLPALFWVALITAVSQVENLIFPFQVQFALTCLAAVCAVWLLSQAAAEHQARPVRFAVAAGLMSTAAIYSMSSGVLLVPGLIVLLLLRRSRPSVWFAFLPIVLASVALFFFHHPSEAIPPLLDVGLAMTRVHYVCNYLASSLTGFRAFAAPAGLCALGLFCLVCWNLTRSFLLAGRRVPSGDAAFVAIAIFVAACGPAATLTSRLVMGAQAALVGRYATMSLLFVATLFALFSRWGARAEARVGTPPGARAWRRDVALPAVAIVVLAVMNAPVYDTIAAGWYRVVLADWQLLRNNVAVDGPSPIIFMGQVDDVRSQISFLHAQRINMFAASAGPPADLLERVRQSDPSRLPSCRGYVDNAFAIDDKAFLLRGWLADPAGLRSMAWVGAIDPFGNVLGAARALADRHDVAEALKMRGNAYGFEAGFRLQGTEGVSAHPASVRIFGLDPGASQPVCMLAQDITIGPLLTIPVSEMTDLHVLGASIAVSGLDALPGMVLPFEGTAWRTGLSATWRVTAISQPAPGKALVVPFDILAGTPDCRLVFHFADGTGLAMQLAWPWNRPAWRGAVLTPGLLAAHGGILSAELHADGDARLIVASPLSATLRPDWSRLFSD